MSQLLWIRYLDDGGLAFIAGQRGCDALIRPFLPPGRYGVLVTVNLPGVRLTRRVEPVRPDFQAPGTDISGGVSNVVHTVFEVVERRAYTLNIMVERAGLCDGMPQGLLLGVHHDFAEVIEVGALCRDNPPDSRWMGVLAPGVYVALIESVWLAGGTYRFTVSR